MRAVSVPREHLLSTLSFCRCERSIVVEIDLCPEVGRRVICWIFQALQHSIWLRGQEEKSEKVKEGGVSSQGDTLACCWFLVDCGYGGGVY